MENTMQVNEGRDIKRNVICEGNSHTFPLKEPSPLCVVLC